MKEREPAIVTGLVVLLVVLALGFYVHRDPRFPGSLAGGILGISAAALLLVPLAYLVVKRTSLQRRVARWVSMRTLLAVHVYAGVLGSILGVLHGGHRFESPLGIALTIMMIVVVLSGFVGLHLMNRVRADMRDQQQLLAGLRVAYDRTAAELAREPGRAGELSAFHGFFARLAAPFLVADDPAAAHALPPALRALRLSESIADVEYAVKTQETFKRAFGRWLAGHVVISSILYSLLGLHAWSAWYFGIRWLA